MLAVDPDEYEMQHYEIQALLGQNDDLQAALSVSEHRLHSHTGALHAAVERLGQLKARMDGLHVYDDQTLHDQLGSLQRELAAVLHDLQQEVTT